MNYRSAHTTLPHRDRMWGSRTWFFVLLFLFLTVSTSLLKPSILLAQEDGVWSGVVTDWEGNPQAALVSINGVSVQVDEGGKFEVKAPFGEGYRNVINAEAAGYGLASIIVKSDSPVQELKIQLNRSQVFTFEPGQPIEIKDEQGTFITIEADALVDENGNPPQSPLQVSLYTYNILAGEIIGDQSAIDAKGEPVTLKTFGMFDVKVSDEKGQAYNLRPGAVANISMSVLDVENDLNEVGLWDYDSTSGLWIEEGVAKREGDRFIGQTPRLGRKNLDVALPLPSPVPSCQANEVLTVLRAGVADAFNPNADVPPATPNAALVAYLNSANPRAPILGVDGPTTQQDYWFAHSFNLNGLSPNISRAWVEFAARPSQSWLSNNDTAWVGFTNVGIWSTALGSGLGLPWTNANYPAGQVFTTAVFAGSDIASMNLQGFLDFVGQDDSAYDYVNLSICTKQADLMIQKAAKPTIFQVGATAEYTLTVSNIGTGSALAPIRITDTLPSGLSFVSVAAPAPWSCTFAAPTLSCTHPGPLAPATSANLIAKVNVEATAAPSVRNCATVRASNESNYTNNESCVQNEVKPAVCTKPTFISEVLSSNRFSATPNNRLQAVVWYDGNGAQSTLQIEYRINATTTGWITIGAGNPGGAIDPFGTQIETREYDMCGLALTGQVKVNGIIANGMIDGLAFGLYTKNNSGQYDLWQSWSTGYKTTSDYVGMWPIGVGDVDFAARTPQLNAALPADLPYIRQTARMIVTSAKYLDNGAYWINPEQAGATTRRAGTPKCGLAYVGENLRSNRSSALPNNNLQVAAWYDGNINTTNPPKLSIEYIDPANRAVGWITIGQGSLGGAIEPFGTQIETREYNLGKCQLTGVVDVRGNAPNGSVDGLAFGLYSKNASGQYKLCQSRAALLSTTSDFVGGWPSGLDDGTFTARAFQVTDGFARQQGMTTMMSSQLARDGRYNLCNYRGYFPAIGTAAVGAADANGVNAVDDAETVALVNPDTELITDDLFLDPTASSEQTVPAVVPTACTDSEGFCTFGEAAPDNWLEYDGTQLGNNELRLRIFLPVASR